MKVFLVWSGFKHHSDNDDLRGVFSTLDKAITHTLELLKDEDLEFREQNVEELYLEDFDEDYDLEDDSKEHSLQKVWENEEEDQYFIYEVEIDKPI